MFSFDDPSGKYHKKVLGLQRLAIGDANPKVAPPIVHEVLNSSGQPLDAETRAFMEPRFGHHFAKISVSPVSAPQAKLTVNQPGDAFEQEAEKIAESVMHGNASPHRMTHDFSQVRIHTDAKAAESARSVGALAYTVGNSIAFAAGQYLPHSEQGKGLLAHELAHVVQDGQTAGGKVRRTAWTPTHADERTASGADRFAAQTFDVNINSLTGEYGHLTTQSIAVSVFVPSGVRPERNKVHVFFGPGNAVETGSSPAEVGLNATMTHGFRGASNSSEWILISVPGRSGANGEANAFNTIDTAGITACLNTAGRATSQIDAIRFSSHSRGSRGLRETLNRNLISGPVPERVVVFDAAFSSLDKALGASGIKGKNMVALNVIDPGRLKVPGSRNIQLDANAMRAIGYSRIVQDAMVTMPTLIIPPGVRSQLLNLPGRGLFTTAKPVPSGMTNISDFASAHATAIRTIVQHENDPGTGLKTFIDTNNLIRLGTTFPASIYSHHLFVAELSHEVVD